MCFLRCYGNSPFAATLLRSRTKLPMPPACGLKVLDPMARKCKKNEEGGQKRVHELEPWAASRSRCEAAP
eukprot:4513272-Amphidinium_carterae.1